MNPWEGELVRRIPLCRAEKMGHVVFRGKTTSTM